MDKILIRLSVPVLGNEFDLFVPVNLKIRLLTGILAEGVSELSNGRYILSGEEMLNQRTPNRLLDPEKTLAEYMVEDGADLVLL